MTKLFPWGEAKKVVSDELTETYDPEHYWVFYFKGNRPLLWLFLSSFSMICSSSPWEGEKKTASVMSDVKFNHHHIIIAVTVFQNYPKRRAFEFSRFWSAYKKWPDIVWPQASGFQKFAKNGPFWAFFGSQCWVRLFSVIFKQRDCVSSNCSRRMSIWVVLLGKLAVLICSGVSPKSKPKKIC